MRRRAVRLFVVVLSCVLLSFAPGALALAQTAAAISNNTAYPVPSQSHGAAYPAPFPSYGATYAAPSPSYGAAQPPRAESAAPKAAEARDYHVDLGVGTEVPISVGGVLTAELPHRFLLQLGAGVMPRAYAEGIDSALVKAGAYDDVVSAVVRSSLGNSLVVRASIGGRPFADHGLEILGGYTLVTMGGSVATADVVNAILVESGSVYQVPAGLGGDIPVSATLHNFHASLGWRWLLAGDRLVIRASISYIQTLDSRFSIKVPQEAAALVPYEALINSEVNGFLSPYFAKYGKAPTLGLSAAVRF